MTFDAVRQVANALLYEGYLLYPYRPDSTKNRQRWNFGTLYPQRYSEASGGTEPDGFHAEFLVKGTQASLSIELRFLQLGRTVQSASATDSSWEQGVERTLELPGIAIAKPLAKCKDGPHRESFSFPGEVATPASANPCETQELCGSVRVNACAVTSQAFGVSLDVSNTTDSPSTDREVALLQSMVSAHVIVQVNDGEFISLLEPEEDWAQAAAACRNRGVFPVLAGEAPRRDILLISPIILYDYPQVAPESVGDFNDATEIDEMLTLRVLTLTEEEKEQMRAADPKGRSILERASGIGEEQFLKLHGTVRGLRRVGGKP